MSKQFGIFHIEKSGDVFVMTMKGGENRFNPTFYRDFHQAMDYVERSEGASALVTTGLDKFYSNGLDITYLTEHPQETEEFLRGYQNVLKRMLCFPMVTVAALNGHAYAGGCLFAWAHDIRIANGDKGFLCMPEIDLGMPFTPGLMALLKEKISDPSLRFEVITVGKKYSMTEAHKHRLVDVVVPSSAVLSTALKAAQGYAGKASNRQILGSIKSELYHDTAHTLEHGVIFRPTAPPILKSKL